MLIIALSMLLVLVGVVMGWVGLRRLTADATSRDPHAYWALGLMTLLPGWLAAFVGLLGTAAGGKPELVPAVAWVLSAAAGLIGAIVTEARVRGVGESAEVHHAPRLWRLGVLALLPAWGIVLIGYVAR
jgi:hypothetical protein